MAAALIGIGIAIGVAIERDGDEHTAAEPLMAAQIGDAGNGRRLFTEYGCASCHSYAKRGGEDGPALDFMRGRLGATDIADMAGRIWNHLPAMERFFEEEGIPFPIFKGHEMADMIAYLHGGGPPPRVRKGEMHVEGARDMRGDRARDMHGEE